MKHESRREADGRDRDEIFAQFQEERAFSVWMTLANDEHQGSVRARRSPRPPCHKMDRRNYLVVAVSTVGRSRSTSFKRAALPLRERR